MQPQEVHDTSGILRDFLVTNLKESASSACYTPIIHESYLELSNGGHPAVTFPSGSNIIHMGFSQKKEGSQGFGDTPEVTSRVDTKYSLDIFFEEATITNGAALNHQHWLFC